jgi:hypothetical protein
MHIESAGQRPEISMDQPIIKKLPQITKCVAIGKIRFNHEYLLFRSENHSHR